MTFEFETEVPILKIKYDKSESVSICEWLEKNKVRGLQSGRLYNIENGLKLIGGHSSFYLYTDFKNLYFMFSGSTKDSVMETSFTHIKNQPDVLYIIQDCSTLRGL